MKQQIGFIGLGKMGQNMVLNMLQQGVDVSVYNRTTKVTDEFVQEVTKQKKVWKSNDDSFQFGTLTTAKTVKEFIQLLPSPSIIILMVKAGQPVDDVLSELLAHGIKAGDIVIDSGNSFYEDSLRRNKELAEKNISYIDCGTSGGLEGARYGACLMIGGDKAQVESLQWLWNIISGKLACDCEDPHGCSNDEECCCGDGCTQCSYQGEKKEAECTCGGHCSVGHDTASKCEECCDDDMTLGGWTYFGPSGAGHFVKMVHNGVEYGIDQAIGEGFQLLAEGPYSLDLAAVADNWTRGSVVRGWLIELLARALAKDGTLKQYNGKAGGGETGRWTIKTAQKHTVPQTILDAALKAREQSQIKPTFATKVVSALRYEYGGHKEESEKK